MQTMSEGMATLLKSGKQIGDNKPTHEIIVGGNGGNRNFINGEFNEKYLGYEININQTITAPIPTNDGKYAFAWIDETTRNVIIGFDGDESFFHDDYTFDSFIDSGIETEASTDVNVGQSCLSLYKRDDGKILLFVNDGGYVSAGYCNVKVYISNNGNCTDFIYYSTIYEEINLTGENHNPKTNMTIPVKSGDMLIIAFNGGYYYDFFGGATFACCYVYASYNEGLTWVLKKEYKNDIYKYNTTGQMACLPDGTLIFETTQHPVAIYFHISKDNGETWQDEEGEPGWADEERGASLYYDDKTGKLYKTCTSGIWATSDFSTENLIFIDAWEHIIELGYLDFNQYSPAQIRVMPSNNLAIVFPSLAEGTNIIGFNYTPLQAKSIQISRSKGMAGGLTVEFDNKNGVLAPDGTTNPALLWPNKEVTVKQGYGTELIQTFNGLIDTISMSTFPQSISINARDKMKALLDHLARDSSFSYVLTYTGQTVEAIWQDLITKAGLTYGTVETTGITLTEKIFSWQTYADCISWLDEIAGFETYCDEFGVMHFVYDGRPAVVTTAYEFVEGVDIIQLGYDIDDKDLYYSVVVYGKDANDVVIYYAATLPQAGYWNIPSGKVMRIDAPDADTSAKCQAIADKAIYLMQTRARQVRFSTIGIPHLQRGDFIQITEASSTISEIYRITDISTSQDSSGYRMELTCYYHAAPEV